jgi:hypothetical protein
MRLGFTGFGIGPPVQMGLRALAPAAVAALVAGCMSTHTAGLDEWGGAQNCHFAHVARKEFETAVRRVFDASNPKAYGLHPEEGGALVEQHWAMDVVFRYAGGIERWRLEYALAGDGIDVRAEVERVERASPLPERHGIGDSGNTPVYRLLWSRVAYVLGSHADWPRCKTLQKLPGSGLCGTDVPPPKLTR